MDFRLKTAYAGGAPFIRLAKDTNTVIPKGSFVGITSGLAVLALDATAKIAYAPIGAGVGETKVAILEDYHAEFIGDADAAFAVANRGAEVDLVFRNASLLTGVAEDDAAVRELIEDGSFGITIDGVDYNIDGIDFDTSADMDAVAAVIQAAIRAETSGTETVTFNATTDKFTITSNADGVTSEVTDIRTSTGTVGTDISVAALLNGPDAVETPRAQLIDLGASSTDVFIVGVGDDAGVVDSAEDITVRIKSTKYLY